MSAKRKWLRIIRPMWIASILGAAVLANGQDISRSALRDVEPNDTPAPQDDRVASGELADRFPQAPADARFVSRPTPGWFAPLPAPLTPDPNLPASISRAFVIPIHGQITGDTLEIVRRKILRCKGKGAQLVVFDLDTPGGRSDAMDAIVALIFRELGEVYTVAYVNPKAFSAGAVIALACNEIVMDPLARMGATMSILIGPGGVVNLPEDVRGKLDSADRTGMRALAKNRGYNALLCEAMGSIDMIVWLVQNEQSGQLRFVEAREWLGVRGAPTIADANSQSDLLETTDRPGWKYVRTVVGPGELVSMDAQQAQFMGFSDTIVRDYDQFREVYNIQAPIERLEDSWSEKLVALLTSPAVSSILLIIGLIGVYSEMQTPGLGVAGLIGVLAFGVLFGSRYLIGLAQWWEIALFALGVALIALEVFVIPGFGVAGVSGILCCLAGLLAIVVPNAPSELPLPKTNLDWSMLHTGLIAMLIAFFASFFLALLLARYLPSTPILSRLVLDPGKGSAVDADLTETSPVRTIRPGDLGVVESMCRPVGRVRFGDHLIDASSEGGVIETGTRVRALRRAGNQIIVEEDLSHG